MEVWRGSAFQAPSKGTLLSRSRLHSSSNLSASSYICTTLSSLHNPSPLYVGMRSIPPPLNAVPYLNDEQRRELSSISAPNRLLGAWLILIRDDSLGEWEGRLLPCAECVHHRLPCVDYARAEPSSRCEGCFRNNQQCGLTYSPPIATQEVPPPMHQTSKKRKLERTDAAGSRDHLSFVQDANIAPKTDGDSPMVGGAGAVRPGDSTTTRPRSAPNPPPPINRRARPPRTREGMSHPSYNGRDVRSILDKALERSRLNIHVAFNQGVDVTDFQRYDYSVVVRSAGTLPTWLVIFVDHAALQGKVLFDDRAGTAQTSRIGNRSPTRVSTERAFDIFHRSVSLEAEIYPCLGDNNGGSFYATALAVEFVLNGPNVPGRELAVDRKQAAELHAMLLANGDVSHLPSAVKSGRESTVVARISRHERRFELV